MPKKANPAIPNAENLITDPEYIQGLVEVCRERYGFKSYDQVAKTIGVSRSALKAWRHGYREIDYAYQFILERLAYS